MNKKIIGTLLIMILFVQSFTLNVKAFNLTPFSDVDDEKWYYEYVYHLYISNVIDGFTDGTFKGNNELYKNQILKMLVTSIRPNDDYTIKTEEVNELGQIVKYPKTNWFKPYLDKARLLGIEANFVPKVIEYTGPDIIEDENGNIIYYSKINKELLKTYEEEDINSKYNVSITREDVATYAYKAYIIDKYISIEEEEYTEAKAIEQLKNKYKDFNSIPREKYKEIYFLNLWEIMQGDTNGNFNPKGKLTRAEASAIVSRITMNRLKLEIEGKVKTHKNENQITENNQETEIANDATNNS